MGKLLISVENTGNKDYKNQKTKQFSAKVVWIIAIHESIIQTPEESWSKNNFNMLPSRFVNCGKEAEDFIVMTPFVKKMSQCTNDANSYYA